MTSARLVTFKVYTGLLLGPPGVGANILATVNFGINTGFSVSDFSSGSAVGTRYPVSVAISDNGSTNMASYTADLVFNFAGASDLDLNFTYQNGLILARILNGSTSIPITIFESKAYR